MPRIYVIGALVYDIVFDVPDWLAPNQAVHASQATLSPGGKALNQAAAASRLGAEDVRLVGCVGDDVFGDLMLEALRADGVNVDFVERLADARTSLAAIVVNAGSSAFIGAPHASRMVSEAQIRRALRGLQPGDIVLVNFEITQPLAQLALQLGREASATTVLNPAPFFTRDAFVVDYLRLVDVVIPNKFEAQLILGADMEDVDGLGRGLLRKGIRQAIVTLAEAGSAYFQDDCKIEQAAYRLGAVDTTGASDAFVGACCLGVSRGWDMRETMDFASAAAGLVCTRRGTMSALPSLEEVRALVASRKCSCGPARPA